jgi:RimJ/RimL family protein N-acetyltransferase
MYGCHVTVTTMTTLVFRAPSVDDAEALHDYLKVLNDDDHPGLLHRAEMPSIEKRRDFIQRYLSGGGHLLLLVDGDRILGCGELTLGKAPYRNHCATLGISLVREARGQGYGTAMIKSLHEWARAHADVDRIQLEVFSTNPEAVKLYERLGYVREGRRQGAIKRSGEFIDMIQMVLLV